MMDVPLLKTLIDNNDRKSDNFVYNMREAKRKRFNRNRLVLKLSEKRKIPKVINYFNVNESYPDDIFQSHFRMSRTTFYELCRKLDPFWTKPHTGRIGLSIEKCLYITLWKLCNGRVSFRILSDRFGIGKGSSFKIFLKTVNGISKLKHEVLWPSLQQQMNIMEDFANSRENPFPFVIGCVDGTHFNIPPPRKDPCSYYDRKGNFTITMQAICDSKFCFIDVFIGYPGSCHDANVWANNPICNAINNRSIQFAENAHLLGDTAYPLSKYLMVPYKDNGHLTTEKKKFNTCLSSTRVFIEQAFGILKKKFQILNYIDIRSTKNISNVVLVCCILHNFIINREKNLDGNDWSASNDQITSQSQPSNDTTERNTQEGIEKRNNLAMLFVS